VLGGVVDDLFSGLTAAAAFDEVQSRADFVRAVHAELDCPRAVVGEQWNAELFGLASARLAGRDADQSRALLHLLAHRVDEQLGGRPGTQPDHAVLG
jgi:hypothetical protein